MELEADGVRPEGRAREPGPLDRSLPLLDPLLRRPAPVVEGDHLLGRATQVGHDEADARVQLAGVPLHLRDDSALPVPALRPIAEAGVEAPHGMGRPSHGPLQEVRDLVLQHLVRRQANGVLEALRFQVLVDLGQREGRIGAQQAAERSAAIPGDYRVQHVAPAHAHRGRCPAGARTVRGPRPG